MPHATMIYVYLVELLALLVYAYTIFACGRARGRAKLLAPAIIGDEGFERAYRVQMNTLENLIIFLPALHLFAILVNPIYGAITGAIWVVGRLFYALVYVVDPAKRSIPFAIGLIAQFILLVWALIAVVEAVARGVG